MKIGIDARLWNQTGVGRYIRNLVYFLEKIDSKNSYVLFVRKEDNVRLKNSNFQLVEVNISWHSLEEQLKFPQLLEKYNLDIIHFPYYSVPFTYRKNFVVTIHDLIPLHFQTGQASTLSYPLYRLKLAAFKFIVSKAAKNAKKIIAPSNETKKDIVKYLKVSPAKIKVVYEGVDKNLENKSIPKKENLILYVGNAYPHKNLQVLFLALRDSKIPNIKLVLVGKEDYFYKRMRKRVKQLDLESKILFNGYASEKELSLLYKKSRVLVIPSFIEGFGLPALEAMANGCLVVASDIPVLHEVANDSAVYFNPNDPLDLSRKLEKAFLNQYQNKIEKGLRRIRNFSWEKTARETLRLYESCVNLR